MLGSQSQRQFHDQHMESIVEYAHSIGAERWVEECHALIEGVENPKAKDLINRMAMEICFRVIDRIEGLNELEPCIWEDPECWCNFMYWSSPCTCGKHVGKHLGYRGGREWTVTGVNG